MVGFFALSSVVEEAKKLPDVPFVPFFGSPLYFPCVQLVYMAMHTEFQKQGYGTEVLGEVVRVFAEVGNAIGIPALILTPINDDAKRFYARLGFEPYDKGTRMFLGLEAAAATFNEASEEIDAEAEG